MKGKRDLKIGIRSDRQFFAELKSLAGQIDAGWVPEQPVERLYFEDLPALLRCLTPKRFELLIELRRMGHVSINALAKHLHRQYRNVFDDVKMLERLGLVEKDASGRFYVPWEGIDASFELVA